MGTNSRTISTRREREYPWLTCSESERTFTSILRKKYWIGWRKIAKCKFFIYAKHQIDKAFIYPIWNDDIMTNTEKLSIVLLNINHVWRVCLYNPVRVWNFNSKCYRFVRDKGLSDDSCYDHIRRRVVNHLRRNSSP